jgi:hypothetical protein
MSKRGPSEAEIATMRDDGDVAALVDAYAATKRRDTRRSVLVALARVGDEGRDALLDLLGDEERQRNAGAVMVELGEEAFPRVAQQLASDDEVRRRGALHAVYLYARYRDLPGARELLRTVSGDAERPDLAEPAGRMAERVELLRQTRNAEIDRHLAKIKTSVERDRADSGSAVMRMYAKVHSGRLESRAAISAMRYAGVRHVIDVAPEYGEAAVGVLLACALEELGGGVVPMIEESLRTPDRRKRGLLLTTLICLRRARVHGAAEALERDGVEITERMDRRAADVYGRWIREG